MNDEDEVKAKLMMMNGEEREAFLNHILDQPVGESTLRIKLIELADHNQQVKEIKAHLEPFKLALAETMGIAKLKNFAITDGLVINTRKGSNSYRVSYKDIEENFPEVLKTIQSIVKTTTTKPTYTIKYIEE